MSGFELVNGRYRIDKDPNARLDYSWDFSEWLAPVADSIGPVQILIAGSPTLTEDGHFVNGGIVTAWLTGGEDGDQAEVTCRITTAGGRTDDRTVVLNIKER